MVRYGDQLETYFICICLCILSVFVFVFYLYLYLGHFSEDGENAQNVAFLWEKKIEA